MNKDNSYIQLLNQSLGIFFKDAIRVSFKNPSQAIHFFQTVRWQKNAARIRNKWTELGAVFVKRRI
jgi:hypothetical protein